MSAAESTVKLPSSRLALLSALTYTLHGFKFWWCQFYVYMAWGEGGSMHKIDCILVCHKLTKINQESTV
jgi:hypothetical protein